MSHKEYIERLDEEQLISLQEMINARLKTIRESGWVHLWVVSDDMMNLACSRDYAKAVGRLSELGAEGAEVNRCLPLHLEKRRFRPEDAEEMLRDFP